MEKEKQLAKQLLKDGKKEWVCLISYVLFCGLYVFYMRAESCTLLYHAFVCV